MRDLAVEGDLLHFDVVVNRLPVHEPVMTHRANRSGRRTGEAEAAVTTETAGTNLAGGDTMDAAFAGMAPVAEAP